LRTGSATTSASASRASPDAVSGRSLAVARAHGDKLRLDPVERAGDRATDKIDRAAAIVAVTVSGWSARARRAPCRCGAPRRRPSRWCGGAPIPRRAYHELEPSFEERDRQLDDRVLDAEPFARLSSSVTYRAGSPTGALICLPPAKHTVRRSEGPRRMTVTAAVSGTTPVGSTGRPTRAFSSVLFPRLNSPIATRLNRRSTRRPRAERRSLRAAPPTTAPAAPAARRGPTRATVRRSPVHRQRPSR
jgi:hypothetical protein